MDQYQLANAVDKIEGYHLPRPLESAESSFERAKAFGVLKVENGDNLHWFI